MKTVEVIKIISIVGEYYGVDLEDMRDPSRKRDLAIPRQIAMYLCRRFTRMSYESIARLFDRNHATIMHAYKKYSDIKFMPKQEQEAMRYFVNRLKNTHDTHKVLESLNYLGKAYAAMSYDLNVGIKQLNTNYKKAS